ncbi:electron transfer flavoprotein subunit beta/FixA family protein [Haloarcula pellucida]|uniref:Electron transfer flavoprotein subunit beta n=1 Tax=Haloarcula pellucida TaxID=1427151 RepID=A0A830GK56_9EURY|nr:electron transfer flavoprotein subunit beta/FixA family protein [Halomicroarcula pellucida]MBX0348839.1 electron transfer flavoprotein subunit beta/FixA family protein [Halomicroarcula pellucida]GGN91598.1 electron transfer flavoprotein subunit beta [Halomicroarcula pellucida]
MKILVTVKEVAHVDDEFEIDGLGIDDRYVTYDLNEWDDYAVEAAVQIQEAGDDVEVVAVTIGDADTEDTIRQALAKGADRAIRVWDDALADAGLLDPETKARLIAAVAAEEDPDLVLTGVQSADDGFGATGVTLAEHLGFEWGAVVNALDLDREAGIAHVHRELEGSVEELTDVELPAVLTIQTGINEPRYASLRGIRQAQSKELAEYSLSDLDLTPADVESSLEQTDLYEPESESEATVFEGSAEETASELAGLLREKGVGS